MKKTKIAAMVVSIAMTFSAGSVVLASEDYGSAGALAKESYTMEEMLQYAIQDERLALAEYQLIMDEFDVTRPFSNIIRSENTHIELVTPLFEKYGIAIPEDTAKDLVVKPETLVAAFETGVQAEVNNIAMYQEFLKQELPEDVRLVFEKLSGASENHLAAFEKGTAQQSGTIGGASRRSTNPAQTFGNGNRGNRNAGIIDGTVGQRNHTNSGISRQQTSQGNRLQQGNSSQAGRNGRNR